MSRSSPCLIRPNRTITAFSAALVLVLGALLIWVGPAQAGSYQFDQAVKTYKAGKYADALAQFQAINLSSKADPLTHYYMGLCYHSLNQVARAQQEYQLVVNSSADPALKSNAQAGLSQLSAYQTKRTYQGQGNTFARGGGSGRPRVIDFYTTWCGPCKRLAPILAEVESQFRSQVDFQRLDAEAPENAELVDRYKIDAYPTVVMLSGNGSLANRIVGLHPKQDYESAVQRLLGR